jgi:MoxR-like ATPase
MADLQQIVAKLETIILGKPQQIRLAVACMIGRGHLLIEDLPGMGKTTLAEALAHVMGLEYQRVQFTSDMLPADIIGVSIFNSVEQRFEFRAGPIFTQVLLADEINRTTPKTQSALLEAMEEGQVTTDGVSRPLPTPFFVIATQNPMTQTGTYPLPESQLDRFFMRIELGYPDPKAERELMVGRDRRLLLAELKPLATGEALQAWQRAVKDIHVSDAVLDYIQRLVQHTRNSPDFPHGLSPRGTLALMRAAQAWTLLDGRKFVMPEDVQIVLAPVAEHRLRGSVEHQGRAHSLTSKLLSAVDILA